MEKLKTLGARTWRAVMNPFLVQVYFILFTFLAEIPVIMQYVQFWKKVGLVWAALVILYDLFTERRCLKARFAPMAFGLLAAYGITTAVVFFRYPAALQETYLDLFCSAATLLLLYPPTTDDRELGRRRLSVLNWMLAALTGVVALLGILMFLTQIGGYLHSDITNYDYPQGFWNRRLTGLYRNAIYPTALIGVMAAAVQWTMEKGRPVFRRVLLGVSVALNVLHIILSNSRGITYALAAFAGIATLFLVRDRLRAKKVWQRVGAGLLAAVVLGGALIVATPWVRRGCAYLPPVVYRTFGAVESPFDSDETSETPVRPAPDAPEDIESVENLSENNTENVTRPEEGKKPDPGADAETGTDTQTPAKPKPPHVSQGAVDVDRDDSATHGVLTGRTVVWKLGFRWFFKNPVFGYGPYALKDQIRLSETSTERISHFHNIFLQSLVSVGSVGSIFFFVLLLGSAVVVLRFLVKKCGAPDYATVAVMGAMLAAILLVNLADTTLFFLSKNSEFVFWTYVGYTLLLTGEGRRKSPLDRCLTARKGGNHGHTAHR